MDIDIIEIIEHCFGPDVRIDGESLFQHEYDQRSDEYVRSLKISLLNELIYNVDNLSIGDLKIIAEIIVTNNTKWEYDSENSHKDTCSDCGNWNYIHKYYKI